MGEKKGRGRPAYWTAERCIQALETFLRRERRMPRYPAEMGPKSGLASPETFRKAVGCSYTEYSRRHEEFKRWTTEKCIAAVDRFVQRNGRRPKIQSEANASLGLPSPRTFLNHTGMTMGAYLNSKYPELPVMQLLELPAPHKCGTVWTKDRIIEATDRFMEIYGRYPTQREYNMKYGLPSHNTISTYFGIPTAEYWRQRYPMAEKGWTINTILQTFERFLQEHGRLPMLKELRSKNGLPGCVTVTHLAGVKNYTEFCGTYFSGYHVGSERWNRELCIQALERFLEEHGRRPTQEDHRLYEYLPSAMTFTRHTGESESQYCKRRHPELSRYWTESKAINAMDQFVERNGRPPATNEFCQANQLPTYQRFAKMVGMPVGTFLRDRYPEYYEQVAKE